MPRPCHLFFCAWSGRAAVRGRIPHVEGPSKQGGAVSAGSKAQVRDLVPVQRVCSPGGTPENSPVRQCWGRWRRRVQPGAARRGSAVASKRCWQRVRPPNVTRCERACLPRSGRRRENSRSPVLKGDASASLLTGRASNGLPEGSPFLSAATAVSCGPDGRTQTAMEHGSAREIQSVTCSSCTAACIVRQTGADTCIRLAQCTP